MSWLSPKRRRTTGNLKTISNGQVNSEGAGVPAIPGTPSRVRTPTSERPPTTPRPLSQPLASSAAPGPDGNLFYAYARRGDDLKSRYLLTFASASIANEWWLLLQAHFPDTTRPGPQLFSFKDPDLLSKAWKHPSFAHLKSKWMYISFGDTKENGVGGAAQGIIPVQDAQGNMLGGGAPASPELLGQVGQVRREAKGVRNELSKMEENFERMMEAVEKNTEQVAVLASKHQAASAESLPKQEGDGYFNRSEVSGYLVRINDLLTKNSEHVEGMAERQSDNDEKLRTALQDLSSRQKNDYLDMSQLSSHLDRIQSLLEQSVNDRKDSAKEVAEQQSHATPQIDWTPLTDRLEKVQQAVEQNSALVKALLDEGAAGESKPGTPFWAGNQAPPVQPQSVDLSPLAEHLQKIHSAIEQQSQHIQALVGFASGRDEREGTPFAARGPGDTAEKSLAPLGEHLEQIYNAIDEGNKHAKAVASKPELKQLDLSPLSNHLEALRRSAADNNRNLKALLDAQEGVRAAAESGGKVDVTPLSNKLDEVAKQLKQYLQNQNALLQAVEATAKPDFAPLAEKFDVLTGHTKQLVESQTAMRATGEAGRNLDLAPLTGKFDVLSEHLEALLTSSDTNASNLKQLIDAQEGVRMAVGSGSKPDLAPLGEKLDGLSEHLESLREAYISSADANASHLERLIDVQEGMHASVEASGKPDLAPLGEKLDAMSEHLTALRETFSAFSDTHASHLKRLIDAQEGMHASLGNIGKLDFAPLGEKLDGLNEHLESLREWTEYNAEQFKEFVDSSKAEREAAQPTAAIDLSPLTEHLGAVRSATEQNSAHVKALLDSHQRAAPPSQNDIDFTPLTDRLDRVSYVLEQQAERRDQSPGTGDSKFLMSALTSHLSKIQAVTEHNAQHVRALREKHSASQDKMHIAVSQTAEQVHALTENQARNDERLEATNSQVRELMAGQREMVDVMRELAKSITAQNKGACDHVVIPPPRKVGRKVVGFVYDAKDGPP